MNIFWNVHPSPIPWTGRPAGNLYISKRESKGWSTARKTGASPTSSGNEDEGEAPAGDLLLLAPAK